MSGTKYLVSWIKDYIKHRDLIARKLKNISVDENIVLAEYKDYNQEYIAEPSLNNFLDCIKDGVKTTIATYNTKHNLSTLISLWEKAALNPLLSLIFINPNSSQEKKWMLFPYTHNKISDEEVLELGLKSLFETVDEISESDINKLIYD